MPWHPPAPRDIAAFFTDRPRAWELFQALQAAMDEIGPTSLAGTKSRVSFVCRTRFCWVHEANLDAIWVAFNLSRPLEGSRCRSGRRGDMWSHHLKVADESEIDDELRGWLAEAWALGTPLDHKP